MTDQALHSLQTTDLESTSPYYIPGHSSLQERRLRALKHGDTFALFNSFGDILPFAGVPDGLFHQDTRFLSLLELRLNGERPLLLSSTVRDDNAVFVVDLTNPDLYVDDDLLLTRDTLHLQRLKFLWQGTCFERLTIRNFGQTPHSLRLSLQFGADFADLFEVRGQSRPRRGQLTRRLLSSRELALRYQGLDGIVRSTLINFTPVPKQLDESTAVFERLLAPREKTSILLEIACTVGSEPQSRTPRSFARSIHAARLALGQSMARAAGISGTNSQFNRLISRSTADLYMLVTDTAEGPYPSAGIPWFCTAFGRDGVIAALFCLWFDPSIARGVLRYLAATQATQVDPKRDAEPGKILHETRSGEMARLGEVPFAAYYGSVDATPLFVVLAGAYMERTGDLATLREIWPQIEAALNWIDRYGDQDGDGFVEYSRRTEHGLVNQGWKDSHDSIFHADGSLAKGPIALCEVQAYVYLAKRQASRIARLLGRPDHSVALDRQADALQTRFEDAFWCEDLGTYAIALDGAKRPCRVRSSNAGHALFAGIAAPDRAHRVATGLLGNDFFAGWGVRTLAASEARYNPMAYHNGSVWPHDNALIALGLDRYGFKDGVQRILVGMFEASNYVDLHRLPELFCGFARQARIGPTFYPVACAPQAWATATPFALLQAALGLTLDHRNGEIRLKRPALPYFLDELRLSGLRLGEGTAELQIGRHGSDVTVKVQRGAGYPRVTVIH